MTQPVLLEVRERRSGFGRFVKWAFWIFQALMLAGVLGTCAMVGPYIQGDDPEVAMGAGMFGAMALGALWLLWPAGTVVLGLLLLFTRGRKRLIQDPATLVSPVVSPQSWSASEPGPAPAPHRPGGSVPPTGGGA